MEGRQSTEIKVWVNGSFDVLHRGHIELIQFASKFGTLRVGIDTDERIKEFIYVKFKYIFGLYKIFYSIIKNK